MVCRNDSEGSEFVMPAKAGIQEHTARACDYTAWIPGLAVLARNDASQPAPQNHADRVLGWVHNETLAIVCTRKCSCFDKPVLSKVEGLSTNGYG